MGVEGGADPEERFRIEDIRAGYGADDLVLNGITLRAHEGQIAVVLGPNGSGKSTALRVATGLLEPREGRVLLDQQDITTLQPHERLTRGVGLLPQGRSVFPSMSVRENLEMGAWVWRKDAGRRERVLEGIFERYPLLADVRERRAGNLSGGQQRLLEIARMMISEPSVVLIDEPGAGLAPKFEAEVYEEIAAIRDGGAAVLLVDQNVEMAVEVANYVYILELGAVMDEGRSAEFAGRLGAVVREWLRVND